MILVAGFVASTMLIVLKGITFLRFYLETPKYPYAETAIAK